MGTNDFNKTPEVSTSIESKNSRSLPFKKELTTLALGIALTTGLSHAQNTIPDTNKVLAQTEVIATDPVTIETILEKHHIIDLETATLEQLEGALADINLALSTITDKEQRKPFLLKKGTIRSQIEIRKSQLEVDEATKKADEATKKADEATKKADEATKKADEATKKAEQSAKELEEARRVLGGNK